MRGLVLALVLAGGCEGAHVGGVDAGARARGTARVGGEVVSTIDGHPIDVATVTEAARSGGVSPELALSRLQDEAILAAEAERAGFGDDPEVRRATRRAAVQALLARAVEAEVTADAIDPAELEAAFDAAPDRFDRPERRRSTHALAAVPEGASPELARAAEAWIRALHAELTASPDPAAALLARRHRPEEGVAFEVTIEDLPPIARSDGADPAYLGAVFGTEAEGLVAQPVRSSLGWHVVVVTEVTEASHLSREEAIAMLRGERLAVLRAARLEELVRELAARTGVTIEAGVVQRALSDPNLLGGGE